MVCCVSKKICEFHMDKEYKESNEITNLTLKKEENGGIVGKEISKNNIIFFFKKSYL